MSEYPAGNPGIERLAKFVREWRRLMSTSRGFGATVHELHSGSETRWAELNIEDIEILLASVEGTRDPR